MNVGPVIILAGDDAFLRREHLAALERDVLGDSDPAMGMVRLDGNASIATVLDEVRTPSMFSPTKLVFVEPADALLKGGGDDGPVPKGKKPTASNRELLESYLDAPPDGATLVLVCDSWLKSTRLHKLLDPKGAVRWCEPIKEGAAPAWITRRAREQYQKGIEPAAAGRLAELIGPDLQRLDNELAKLSLYQPNAATITVAFVDALVGFQHEQQIWDMLAALTNRNAHDALRKIDELWQLDPKIEYTAIGAVFSWLNSILKAREMLDARMPDGAVIRDLRLWPQDKAQRVLALARGWGIIGASHAARELLQVDLANKTSVGTPRRNLERFVVEVCGT